MCVPIHPHLQETYSLAKSTHVNTTALTPAHQASPSAETWVNGTGNGTDSPPQAFGGLDAALYDFALREHVPSLGLPHDIDSVDFYRRRLRERDFKRMHQPDAPWVLGFDYVNTRMMNPVRCDIKERHVPGSYMLLEFVSFIWNHCG